MITSSSGLYNNSLFEFSDDFTLSNSNTAKSLIMRVDANNFLKLFWRVPKKNRFVYSLNALMP
ncbi:hypothetical protein RCA_00730 [Rickettsia canadensis str. CA410]|uniref:Uncharacterized protein n=1 Tax=Rickettsia canadensis str. CA410 TaxID=1105107 RepID=A0ABM5MQV5_RICCA|nr:hypothetical protein RCA_00730 [Rickettsia canadensis str. CA410]